ncbi:MAG: type II secretion system F family protein [Pseudomonadota bacterium]
MAVWRLSAATPAGDCITELVEATSQQDAIRTAQARGLVPIDIAPHRNRRAMRRKLPKRDLEALMADLAALLGSHVPLPQALQTISDANASKGVRAAAAKIATALRDGVPLSTSFQDLLQAPPHVAAAILAGERGSDLGRALDDLGRTLDRQRAAADALTGAMIYPAILMIVTLISLVVILVGVVPGIEPLISGAGSSASPSARMLVTASQAVQDHGAVAGIAFATAMLIGLRALQVASVKSGVQNVLFRLPLVGRILRATETAGALRTIANLTSSGMGLPEAVALSAGAARTRPFAQALEHISEGVREGKDFLQLFEANPMFDRTASGLVAIGFQSGNLPEMLNASATALEREVEKTTKRIVAVLPAAMTLVLGGLVGGLSIIVLGAIMSVNDVVL